MTVTDLRISYKLDTGNYPLYEKKPYISFDLKTGESKTIHRISYTFMPQGIPRDFYGEWLEEKLNINDTSKFRNMFFRNTGQWAINKQFGNPLGYIKYNKEYIYWLEELYLKIN